MIIFSIALAFIDVFLVSQVDFWGITPLLFAALLYTYRYDAPTIEIVTASAAYGFVVGSFQLAESAFVSLLSYVLSATLAIGLLRTVGQSKYRIKMRGYDAALMVASFTCGFWTITSLFSINAVHVGRTLVFVVWSMAFNVLLMMCTELVNKKIASR